MTSSLNNCPHLSTTRCLFTEGAWWDVCRSCGAASRAGAVIPKLGWLGGGERALIEEA